MIDNPKQMLEHLTRNVGKMSRDKEKQFSNFSKFVESVFEKDSLDTKTKELIAIAISVYSRCQYCIVSHTKSALESGATKDEILEAATVAMAFGGGPAMAYSASLLVDSLEEFSK